MAFLVLLVWTHLRIIILKERTLVIKPNSLQVPKYDWYGYYGHQRSVSKYEQIMREDYAKWSYAPYIYDAIRNEVKECRENVALFDLSSFGKVRNRVAVGISVPGQVQTSRPGPDRQEGHLRASY